MSSASRNETGPRGSLRPSLLGPSFALALAAVLISVGCGEKTGPARLTIREGANNPGAPPGRIGHTGVAVLQMALTASEASLQVSSIRFHATGSGDDAAGLTEVRLYLDGDGDGTVGVGDALLGAAGGYSADDGDLSFSGLAEQIPEGRSVHWLLVYDIAPGASSGESFCASVLTGSDVAAAGRGGAVQVAVVGDVRGCIAASTGALDLGPGPNSPPPREVSQCGLGEVVLQLQLSAAPPEDVQVDSMTFTASGTGDDAGSIAAAWLYEDVSGDGLLDVADLVIDGPAAYSGDDGTVTFSGLGEIIPASSTRNWILVYNFSGNVFWGMTFAARVQSDGDVSAMGIHSGRTLPVAGPPVSGGEVAVWGPVLRSAAYVDANDNGLLDPPDTVTLDFSHDVNIPPFSLADDVFTFEPPGSFGNASMALGPGPNQVEIALTLGSRLQPNGSYGGSPGSTGLNVAFGQTSLRGCVGRPVEPVAIPVDLEGELIPRVTTVAFSDLNGNCVLDGGDTLDVSFTANVTFTTTDPDLAFALPVSGDSFGAGAQFLGGTTPVDTGTVTVVLGTSPSLTVSGTYSALYLAPGDPSGLDVGTAAGMIVDPDDWGVAAASRFVPGVDLIGLPAWSSVGDDLWYGEFGRSVAPAGDVNADGYDDFIVGAPGGPYTPLGTVNVYHGGPAAPSQSPDWISSGDLQAGAHFGFSVAPAGDVNADGYDDVIVGAPWSDTTRRDVGKVYLYLGGPGGLSGTPVWTSVGDDWLDARFGLSVASAGDTNGDGFDDVIVGAPFLTSGSVNQGKAYVYLGGPGGLSASPAWTSEGDGHGYFGESVASAGDVNGDGFDEIIVSAPWAFAGGKVYVHLGSPSGPSAAADWSSLGEDLWYAEFGRSVSSAGDVDGDGYGDVIMGAPLAFPSGKAYVFFGGPAGLAGSPGWTGSGSPIVFAWFGSSVTTMGDVNGDGFDDVLIGDAYNWGKAHAYFGAQTGLSSIPDWSSPDGDQQEAGFGLSVAFAGDLRNDGSPEVLIGAPYFDATNTDAGKAYLFCLTP